MAVKKTKKKEESATPAKAEAKETAPKKTAKKAAAPKAAAPEPAAPVAPTPAAPAPETKKAAPKKAAAKKAAAPLKLSASQDELLKKIGGAGEAGYSVDKKEQRSVESLLDKKLIKKGAKNKASGVIPYHLTSSGKKHIS